MLSRCCIFHAQDSEPILGMKFTACRKLPWCAGRLQYSAHYRYPQSFPQSVAAVIACSHYHSPIVKYGTVEKSNLAKCRQDDLCCRRTIRRWNPEACSFRLMYGTPAADEKFFIHTPVSTERTVPVLEVPRYMYRYSNTTVSRIRIDLSNLDLVSSTSSLPLLNRK